MLHRGTFPQLSAEDQDRSLTTFVAYVEVPQKTLAHNESLTKQHQFLQRMIRKLGLHPMGDLFSMLKESDVIEIYDMPSNVQIFRSFNMFELKSYTLDNILSRPCERLLLCQCDNVFLSPLLNQEKHPEAVINVVRGEVLSEGKGHQ